MFFHNMTRIVLTFLGKMLCLMHQKQENVLVLSVRFGQNGGKRSGDV